MFLTHMRFIPKDIFYTLSDKTKLIMMTNQLFFVINGDADYDYQEVFAWLCENSLSPFYILKEKKDEETKAWVFFYDEIDLVAFKLRWM